MMLKCGVGVREITSSGPVHLMGYAARWDKLTDGAVHDPIWAKALYLESAGTRVMLISADLCELTTQDAQAIETEVCEKTGVSSVMVSVTHTHSAPNTSPQPEEGGGFDPKWFAWVRGQMLEAAMEAAAHPFEARMGVAQTDAPEVGKNRRAGHTITDPCLTAFKFEDASGTVRAVLLNYPCHCTILDGNSFAVSSDYPGYLYTMAAERYPDAVALFTNGAAGDINIGYPVDASALGEAMSFRSFAKAEEMARILFEKADALFTSMRTTDSVPLRMTETSVDCPLKQDVPSDEELMKGIAREQAIQQSDASAEEKRAARIREIYIKSIQMVVDAVGRAPFKRVRLQILRLGDFMLVGLPVELFCQIGMDIKAALPLPGAVVGYAGGYVGYLPTDEALQEGGYEAETSMFSVGTGAALIESIRQAACELV